MATPTPPPTTNLPILFLNPQTNINTLKAQLRHFIFLNIPISIALVLTFYWFAPETDLWKLGGVLLIMYLAMLGLIGLGYFKLSLYVLPATLVSITFLGAQSVQDQQGLFVSFFGLAILTAAVLLGSRATAVVVLISIAATTYLFLQPQEAVLLPPLLSILLAIFPLLIFGFIGHYAMRKLVLSFWEVQHNNTNLSQVEQQLREQQAALERSEQTKKAILESIPDMMALIDKDGRYLEYQALQYFREEDPPESVIGQTVQDKLPPHLAQQRMAHIQQTLATREIITYQESQSVRGQAHFFSTRIMAVDEERVLVMMRDVTEEKRQEAANLAAQKLESVGLLAGGVAHDFNNLLTGMMAQTSLAIAKLPEDAPAARHIVKANLAAERAADLTRQLLAYTGQGGVQLEPLDLNQIIQENAGLLQASLPVHVDLALHLTRKELRLVADRGHIHQVVMNLIINAAEAIQDEYGRVHLRTKLLHPNDVPRTAYMVDHRTQPNQPHICLRVRDTGVGIGSETMVRIFDPFFSKKKQGRGLGLSATLGIIRRYHGAILVDSQPNEGTTFWVLFPLETKNSPEGE
jgi:signal transduction histidine kinase